ncbi:MAG TPA: aromatic-ring-hydroxylating dioxygenase subunit beta [Ramlibacter sp.]|uniref:aromatic-ring-hydroxylating dioxygenase subunit beta n=1 Tax=Ramlibacter sp. TaxID=1917967 RepID=UPI002C99E67E|nr:aromatic-ring-hydroxylating dioxygenase subunit beta [Ramlibacter sp.]HVZ46548.1 aromatic-ring-hydroxylating dioxygenase subunit beta [Ramlibacter sp.]
MASSPDTRGQVEALLLREAECLDERLWDEWLALFSPSVEYWVPAWDGEVPTSDPGNELSLIYYDSRSGLEDRVFRIRSKRSVASHPLPRTCHFVTNIRCLVDADGCAAKANWRVCSWRNGKQVEFWGRYEYALERGGEYGWLIRRKKILLMNDVVPGVLDIYLI